MLLTILYIYKEALSALQNNKVFTYLCACLISSSLPPGKLLGALPRMLNSPQRYVIITPFYGFFDATVCFFCTLFGQYSQ